MSYDANDEKQVNKARKQAAFDKALELSVIKGLMQTPAGRRWVHTLLSRCHVYATPFTPGQQDVSDFKMGEQNFGLQFLADIQEGASEEYLVMLKEAKANDA